MSEQERRDSGMYDVVGHIFGGLDSHERRLIALEQRKQGGSGWLTVGLIAACAGVVFLGSTCNELIKRVDALEMEVNKNREILSSILVPETEDKDE